MGALLATSLVAGLLGAGLLMPAVGAAGAVARGGVHAFDSLPAELKQSPLAQQSRILAADGSVIATFYDENRVVVPLAKVSKVMQTAIVAIEDDRFYQHGGVDLHGLARAFVNNAQGGGTQGASTITQQYVKNTLVENAKADGDVEAIKAATDRGGTSGYARKLQELKYAVGLEKTMTKDEILQGYLNIAYFGAGTYGVEAAALHYFGVHAIQLNLPQSAMLAGLVQSPSHYDPYLNLSAGTARRNTVLARMLALKDITPVQYQAAVASKVVLHKGKFGNDCSASRFPYFCDYVRRLLSQTEGIGAATLQRGGLTVRTTLLPKAQYQAQKVVDSAVPPGNKRLIGAASSVVEPGTGKILAMVQNTQWKAPAGTSRRAASRWPYTQVNYNTDQGLGNSRGFQTGSSFKAFTLAAALKSGMKLNDTVVAPHDRTRIYGFRDCSGAQVGKAGGYYDPSNAEGNESGKITLLKATAASVNTAFVQLEEQVGICNVAETAESMGVHRASPGIYGPTKLEEVPSLTLGSNLISPLTMAAGYATFAAQGTYCAPVAITAISAATGKKYAVPKSDCHRALSKDVANGVTKALQGVLSGGTARGVASVGRDAAGKTGTTNDSKQSWFVGYTPQLTAAVWVGQPIKETNGMHNLSLGSGKAHRSYGGNIFGATIAGPIWSSITQKLDDVLNLSPESFTSPPFSIIGSAPKPKPKPTPTGGPTGGPTTGGPGNGGGGNCKPLKCPPPH